MTETLKKSASSTLSVLIPVYNERATIQTLISRVKAANIGQTGKEIIVIDDGSVDGTFELVETISDIRLLRHEKNQGKGAAVRSGIAAATGDIIIIQDGDLEYDPNDYLSVIEPIMKGEAEVVYGSRRLNRNNKQHSAFRFYLGGAVLTFITNLLYPGCDLTDEPTCYKAFRSSLLKDIDLRCTKFEFCPEVTAKILRRKVKIMEVPISYYPRSIEQGKKIGWRDGIHAVWTLLRYRL